MKPSSYHRSFLNKMSHLLLGKTISHIIQIRDGDNDLIDNVVYLETDSNGVAGFYMNGANPLVSRSRINEFDDFNLHALYPVLREIREEAFAPLRVEFIKVFFHPDHNEVISAFLSPLASPPSVLIIFSMDEIYIHFNCSPGNLTEIVKSRLTHFEAVDFFTCQIGIDDDKWLCS